MLAILTTVFGFMAPFLPELLKFLNRRQDHQHEMDRMRLSAEMAKDQHTWRMAELNATADIEEAKMLHQPLPSSGVALLDAAREWKITGWAFMPAFYVFAMLDALASAVRPTITFAAFGGYLAYKWACINMASQYVGGTSILNTVALTIFEVWKEEDWAVLTLVLSYWFGHRAAKGAFGGSANTHARGA